MIRFTLEPTLVRFFLLGVALALVLAPASPAAEIGFSTFLAGSLPDVGTAVALAPDGGVVIAGKTRSRDFPTVRALQDERAGNADVFVVKLDPTGTRIEFATYLGGKGKDYATDVAVDREGNVYLTGTTFSSDFPEVDGLEVPGPIPGRYSFKGFLTKLSPDGQEILFSTYLGGGGNAGVSALAYEQDGRVFVSGITDSSDFLQLPAPPDFENGAFVVSIDTVEARVLSGRLFGGDGVDDAGHLAWDAKRKNLWAAGFTDSADFPSVRPLRQTSGPVHDGGFVTRFRRSENSLELTSSSILPAAVQGLAVDRRGRVHLTFLGASSQGAWDDMIGLCGDGGQIYTTSTYFRLQANGRTLQNVQCLPTQTRALAVDRKGRIVTAGRGLPGLPVKDPIQAEARQASSPLYVAVLKKGAAGRLLATYFGGRATDSVEDLAVSRSGKRIVLTGSTKSIDFPLVSPVQAEKPPSDQNRIAGAFVTELGPYR